jgi:ferredoxin
MHAPQVFQQDEITSLVKLVDAEPPQELWESVRAAVDACPVGAIRATDP